MAARIPSVLDPPIMFAEGGASANVPGDTLEAFDLAVRLGATGLETSAWVTADGVPVLAREGSVRAGLRKKAIAELSRSALPADIPSLADVYQRCGTALHLGLGVGDDAAARAVVAASREAEALDRLWLRSEDPSLLTTWRALSDQLRLVHVVRARQFQKDRPEPRAAQMAEEGIDAISTPVAAWTGGLVTLFHRFDRLAFASGAQHRRELDAVLDMGIDAVTGTHVDRMVDSLRAIRGD